MRALIHFCRVLTLAIGCACAGNAQRNNEIVAAEIIERHRPLLSPPGATYFREVTVELPARAGLEIDRGSGFEPAAASPIQLRATTTLSIRDAARPQLISTETYVIVHDLVAPGVNPPASRYERAVVVSLKPPVANAQLQYMTAGEYLPYDAEPGITLAQSTTLAVRSCVAGECSAASSHSFTIASPVLAQQGTLPAERIVELTTLTRESYHQKKPSGLAALMDEAKLAVIHNPTLIALASRRQRFLAQHNEAAAATACTTVARYLYLLASGGATAAGDFAAWYVRHIDSGDIAADADGNFVWIMNGAQMVSPYLPDNTTQAYEFHRSAAYPTDYSVLAPVYAMQPVAVLLRDGPSGQGSTHTFAAVRSAEGFIMLDTYFSEFTGTELKASAGFAWPYAYRFGPAGSRYLHYAYGY